MKGNFFRQLHFVDFDLLVTVSAVFCLGSCKSGRIGMPCWQHGGTHKLKSKKYSCRPDGSLLSKKTLQIALPYTTRRGRFSCSSWRTRSGTETRRTWRPSRRGTPQTAEQYFAMYVLRHIRNYSMWSLREIVLISFGHLSSTMQNTTVFIHSFAMFC